MILAYRIFYRIGAPEHDIVREDGTKKILCIEDNPDECELVKVILAGYDVTCVATIAAARALLEAAKYALVIIDEHLPDGSGLMLCYELIWSGQDAPVIMVSGDPYVTSAEAEEAGAKAFISKSSQTYVEDLYRFANLFALSAKARS
jgi:DNA-binding NtrC family response regulator